jgi:hypothetical protein
MTDNMLLLIQVGAVVTGGAGVCYWAGCKVDEWWQSKKASEAWLVHAEQCRQQAEADYIRELTEENERLSIAVDDMSHNHMVQTLDWCEERKKLITRLNFVCRELTFDDTKKTQVIEPYKPVK